MLSQNNAEQRLLSKAYKLGLVKKKRHDDFLNKEKKYYKFVQEVLKKTKIKTFTNIKNKKTILNEKKDLIHLLKRDDVDKEKIESATAEVFESLDSGASKTENFVSKLQGIDEIIYIDLVASLYGRSKISEIVSETTKDVFIPFPIIFIVYKYGDYL